MCGYTRQDRIQNEIIQKKIDVILIEVKVTKNRLRLFDHVQRRLQDVPIRRDDDMIFSPVKRGRERLKRTFKELIKEGLRLNNIF